jgi:hypothetical protein
LSKDEEDIITRKKLDYIMISYPQIMKDKTSKSDMPNFLSKMYNEKESSSTWGYSKDESGMPPHEKAGLNRASPRYISYFYLAFDINTALAETKAVPKQIFSVAKYKTIKALKIVDLCKTDERFKEEDLTAEEWSLCLNICRAFSSPSLRNEKDYLISQYIAELIKTLGFEGIAFRSSRNRDGVNLTLFEDSACEFLGSELHEVTEIKVESKRLLPFPAE